MITIRKSEERGVADLGWLNSRHTFSFGEYYDPRHVGFSDLLVINDDQVEPRMGFGRHSHRDMEIFSYVLEGKLEHKDSMGTGSIIEPGEVQMMSAGSGVTHSEFNASADRPVHFLQIWIRPDRKGVAPRYQQKRFDEASKRGRLQLIISPQGEGDSLSVYQNARVYAGLFDGDESLSTTCPPGRDAYVHVARGSIEVNGVRLSAGDGARIQGEQQLAFARGQDAEVLLFDLNPAAQTA